MNAKTAGAHKQNFKHRHSFAGSRTHGMLPSGCWGQCTTYTYTIYRSGARISQPALSVSPWYGVHHGSSSAAVWLTNGGCTSRIFVGPTAGSIFLRDSSNCKCAFITRQLRYRWPAVRMCAKVVIVPFAFGCDGVSLMDDERWRGGEGQVLLCKGC